MKTTKRITRKLFCNIYPDMNKIRRSDNYEFEILFNDWKRIRQNGVIN